MRVLDLGCGSGRDLTSWGVTAADAVTGLNIDDSRLAIAYATAITTTSDGGGLAPVPWRFLEPMYRARNRNSCGTSNGPSCFARGWQPPAMRAREPERPGSLAPSGR
jgi:hypothetical protein